MPLQQINLDQSIYNKKPTWGQNFQPQQTAAKRGGGIKQLPLSGDINAPNSFVEQQKAEWAAADKATKQQRDMQLQQAQEVGMRVAGQVQQEGAQQQQQQLATKQQIESNPEPAAKEMYELMKTLEPQAKEQLLTQLFTPTSSGSTISGGGKTVSMLGKYNPIANVFLEKGWAMFDPKGNVNLSEPVETFEKGTFTQNANGDVLNTATGAVIYKKEDIPEGITSTDLLDIMKEGRAYVTGLVDPSYIESLTPEGRAEFFINADKKFKDHVTWLLQKTYNLTLEEATGIANKLPKQEEMAAPTGGGTTITPDEQIVADLKRLFAENPDEVNKRKLYEDKYGAENVNKALGETNKPLPIIPTTQTTPTIYSKGTLGKAGAALNKFFQPK